MTNPVYSDSDFRDAFLYGAARAFFVSGYVDWVENLDDDHTDEVCEIYNLMATMDGNWSKVAPEAPPNAYALAGELWAGLYALNDGCGVFTLVHGISHLVSPTPTMATTQAHPGNGRTQSRNKGQLRCNALSNGEHD